MADPAVPGCPSVLLARAAKKKRQVEMYLSEMTMKCYPFGSFVQPYIDVLLHCVMSVDLPALCITADLGLEHAPLLR